MNDTPSGDGDPELFDPTEENTMRAVAPATTERTLAHIRTDRTTAKLIRRLHLLRPGMRVVVTFGVGENGETQWELVHCAGYETSQ